VKRWLRWLLMTERAACLVAYAFVAVLVFAAVRRDAGGPG
jgi:hypothetical protein